jgi:hypothetical protein
MRAVEKTRFIAKVAADITEIRDQNLAIGEILAELAAGSRSSRATYFILWRRMQIRPH